MSQLGKFILDHRTSKKLSRRKLGEMADISHTEIQRIENGIRKNPSPPVLRAIAVSLGVKYEDIMTAAGYIDQPENDEPIIAARLNGIEELSTEDLDQVQSYIDFLISKKK